jgi:Flp pilus assembly protein TadD
VRTYKTTLVSTAVLSSLAALGCSGFPSFRQGSQTTPLGVAQPGPMTKFANAVADSSLGKSVSKALQTKKKKATPKNDPTALATGVKRSTASDYVTMGENLEQSGDGEGARRMFHKALEMEPHHLGALIGLGRHFDRQGQFDRASEHYAEAAKYHPKDATAFNDLGLCYARQRKYDEAAKALSRAIELEPDCARYRNNIAMVLVAQGCVSEALAHLTDAHGPAIAHYNLGFLLSRQGLNDAALEQFQLALQYNPGMEEARDWIAALNSLEAGPAEQAIAATSTSAPESTEAEVEPTLGNGVSRDRVTVAARGTTRRDSPDVSADSSNLQPLPAVGPSASPILRR